MKCEEHFCEELQELLDRYKTQLSTSEILDNAQKVFYKTILSDCIYLKEHDKIDPMKIIEAGNILKLSETGKNI